MPRLICLFSILVLFVADVRINFDNYRQSMIATSDSKTVFTPNPGKLKYRG